MSHQEVLLILQIATGSLVLGLLVVLAIGYPRAVRQARRRQQPPPPRPRPPVEARPEPRAVPVAEPATAPAAAPEAIPEPPAPEPIPEPEPVPAPPRRPDFLRGLRKSRGALIGRLERLLRGRDLDADTLEEVEAVLFGADLGVRTADDLLEAVRSAGSAADVRDVLEARARDILAALPDPKVELRSPLHVIMMVGVNGSGKTTSIGKLATRYAAEGRSVVVAAADTYRAAAIDQLAVWAERSGAELVRGEPGGDPAAVAFDAVKAAQARSADVVIIDTAGRLQTDQGLMDELAKISRVIQKDIPDAPHETLLVLDANTGQNAIRQAQEFSRAVPVTGILLAKLDGTAKGGVVLGIAQEVGLPVRWIGLGETADDLDEFDADAFARALFTPDEADSQVH